MVNARLGCLLLNSYSYLVVLALIFVSADDEVRSFTRIVLLQASQRVRLCDFLEVYRMYSHSPPSKNSSHHICRSYSATWTDATSVASSSSSAEAKQLFYFLQMFPCPHGCGALAFGRKPELGRHLQCYENGSCVTFRCRHRLRGVPQRQGSFYAELHRGCRELGRSVSS